MDFRLFWFSQRDFSPQAYSITYFRISCRLATFVLDIFIYLASLKLSRGRVRWTNLILMKTQVQNCTVYLTVFLPSMIHQLLWRLYFIRWCDYLVSMRKCWDSFCLDQVKDIDQWAYQFGSCQDSSLLSIMCQQ